MRTVPIQPRVDRDLYFKFRALCHSNGVTVERAVEELIRSALERAGVSDGQHAETQAKPYVGERPAHPFEYRTQSRS